MATTAPVPAAVDSTTDDLLRRIEQLGAEAQTELEALMVQRQELDARITYMRGVVRRLVPQTPAPPKQPAKPATKTYASLAAVSTVAMVFADRPDQGLTVVQAAELAGLNSTTVRNAINQLREQQLLRAAERERVNGGPSPSQFYRTLDQAGLERVAEGATDAAA